MNNILKEDFTRILSEYDFSDLKDKSIFITGATGLIGSQLLRFLHYLNQNYGYKMELYALVRDKEKVVKFFGNELMDNSIHFVYGDVLSLPQIDAGIDYIIHGASITASKQFIEKAVETIDIAVNGTLNLLRFAKEKKVTSFVYLSSMEAFGVTDGEGVVREEDLGYIDISNPRSSYMESKRMCENLCVCFAHEYGLNTKCIRLTQTLGAGIDYNDTRVAAYFARSVLEGSDIVLKTEGKSKRPILYSADAITAILTVLLKGKFGNIYTAANPQTFATIRETAEMVAGKITEGKIKVVFDIDVPAEYAPNLNLNLNVDKLCSLGWKPVVGLEDSYRRLITGILRG